MSPAISSAVRGRVSNVDRRSSIPWFQIAAIASASAVVARLISSAVTASHANESGLVAAGGYAAARERALLRTEGRDYVVRDGEVVTIKFSPPS